MWVKCENLGRSLIYLAPCIWEGLNPLVEVKGFNGHFSGTFFS